MLHFIYRFSHLILNLLIAATLLSITVILAGYFYFKPSLPSIDLVDENVLQVPMKIFSADEKLIGEFGEQKRRTLSFDEIPENVKYAFLAAEDDQFFSHTGFRLLSFTRALLQIVRYREIVSGGGTITMQVVRGYLLSRDQNAIRKLKEIYLAFELESKAAKEEIFSLYVNRIFLGNRAYGVESAAEVYFGKSVEELSLDEAALIAASAQLPSRINPIRNPERSKIRRNWILQRMHKLGYIGKGQYLFNARKPINLFNETDSFESNAEYFAELVRQTMIERYGLDAYNLGWNIYTTLDTEMQNHAEDAIFKNIEVYSERYGWIEKNNFAEELGDQFFDQIILNGPSIIFDAVDEADDSESIFNKLGEIFESHKIPDRYLRALIADVQKDQVTVLTENYDKEILIWDDQYGWARKRSNNKKGPKPDNFFDLVRKGDLVTLSNSESNQRIIQIPPAEAAFVSMNPKNGHIKTYIGGTNFLKTKFDRVRQSFPQTGSSFKPFIYASAISRGYDASSLINDAPIIFEDENLEDYWRPENYTKKFYGLTRLREALVQSINIVSIKLLRNIGVENVRNDLQAFGFEKRRLPSDLSLALGSSSFSPIEMTRAFSILVNEGKVQEPVYITKVEDRNGNIIYEHQSFSDDEAEDNINFPWINNEENIKPIQLINAVGSVEDFDARSTYVVKDILKEAMQRGSNRRRTESISRNDFGGKTGTTNDSISTWFSGFHEDLVTTVWIGNDDFSSLGEDEFGSTIALPIWVSFMEAVIPQLPEYKTSIPQGISFVRVNKETGERSDDLDDDAYFELLLD